MMEPKLNERKDWTGKRILVVEDEEANFLYLKRILEMVNATVFGRGRTGSDPSDGI